ncbi:MAG TPA: glycosyltransferase family 4 protein [Flavobacteriales bacterium]|nr:glycosyltransferase family 4 protein [Flavobacteriales bacterium]
MTSRKKNIFIHGRPSGHPLHMKYGASVDAEFVFVDHILRWHDKGSGKTRKYTSWLLSSAFLPRKRSYSLIISEGPHFMVGMLRWLRLIRKKQKLIALLDNETLYFIDSGYYKKRTKNALVRLIKKYDGIISAGKMEADLARKYAGPNAIVKQIFNGIEDKRLSKLLSIQPNTNSNNILFIGNIGAGWRSWYKGFDILLKSFEIAWQNNSLLHLQLIGLIDSTYLDELTREFAPKSKVNIDYIGYTSELDKYLTQSSLYLHPARGEAWGISVTEAMAAGIMPLVSNLTGSQEAVAKVDPDYIVELDENKIAAKILSHFGKETIAKNQLAEKCKIIAEFYSETNAIRAFSEAIAEMEVEFTKKQTGNT